MKKQMYNRLYLVVLALLISTTVSLRAQNYAFMYIANGSTSSSTITGGSWYTVGSETGTTDDFVAGSLSGWNNSTANRLTETAGESKRYLVQFSLSFGGSVTSYDIGVSVNGAAPSDLITSRSIGTATKDRGNVTGNAHLTLNSGDYLELKVRPSSSASITTYQAQVVLVEMTQASESDYGGMVITGNTTSQTVGTAGTFEALQNFSAIGNLKGWTMGTNVIKADANSAGTYFVMFSVSMVGYGNNDASAAKVTLGVSVADAAPDKILTDRATSASDIGNMGGAGIITVSDADNVGLYFTTGKTNPITINYANICLFKLSGSTTSSYGGMSIGSTDQSISLTQNTWTEVTGFATKTLNNWTFASNGLNATTGTLSAGVYMLEYSASVDASNSGSSIVREFRLGVNVGGVLHAPTQMNRKLSSSSDVGAVGGLSLITIDSDTDIVKFMIMNNTDGGTLDVKNTSLMLHQVELGVTSDGSLPVELSKWAGTSDNGKIRLEWTTESEIENQGFIIQRKYADESEFREIASYMTDPVLLGQGSTTKSTQYAFIDFDVVTGETYDYQLCDVDYKGKITRHEVIRVLVTEDDELQQPDAIRLMHAYPNPFNPTTSIEYALLEPSQVNLTIYDLAGNRVAELVEGRQEVGDHSVVWNGLNGAGQPVPAGVYLANLHDRAQSRVLKITYLK